MEEKDFRPMINKFVQITDTGHSLYKSKGKVIRCSINKKGVITYLIDLGKERAYLKSVQFKEVK